MRTLFTADGHSREVDPSTVQRLLAAPHQVFWLDMQAPDDDDYRLLSDTFKFHQLTIEDVKHQNQRPKLDGYDGYVFAVVFVIALDGEDVSFREHHLYIAPDYLVSVHLEPEPSFDTLNDRIAESPESTCRKSSFLTYLVMDSLVDTTFAALETLDESVDKLQDEVLENANNAQLALLQDMKHSAVEMRRVLGAQRDMFQRLVTLSLEADRETTAYYRDVYDHIIRQYETVELAARPADWRDGCLPLHCLEPAQHDREGAHRRGEPLSPADVSHRVLRHELRLARLANRHPICLHDRSFADGNLDHHPAGVLPPSRLDLTARE